MKKREIMKNRFMELYNQIEREGTDQLLDYLELCGYFEAPASTQYHLAKDGGLLEHSLNVTELMLKIAPTLGIESNISIIIVGLFHDIGKAGYYGKTAYTPNILKSGKRSDAKPYEINKEMLNVPHEVSAIHILSQYNTLTESEVFAILYHNGLYTSLGYQLKGNEQPLQMLLHFADMWASRVIEK